MKTGPPYLKQLTPLIEMAADLYAVASVAVSDKSGG